MRGIVARDAGICHICHHGGARQLDLLEPHTERPELAWVPSNARAAHGAPGNPCPVCSPLAGRPIVCNQIRAAMSAERARRIIAERIAANQKQSKEKQSKEKRKTYPGVGREW